MVAGEGWGAPKAVEGITKVCGHIVGLSKRKLCPSCEHPVPPREASFSMEEKGPGGQGFLGTRFVVLTWSW